MNKINFKIRMLVDTREKNNEHILRYFEQQNISYRLEKLDFGDYSFEIVRDPKENNIDLFEDISFTDKYSIERKANLEELSNNLTHDRDRFMREIERANKMIILIENGSYKDMVTHNYNTKFNPRSYVGNYHTIQARYNIPIHFVDKAAFGNYIYWSCYYHAREYLKNKLEEC